MLRSAAKNQVSQSVVDAERAQYEASLAEAQKEAKKQAEYAASARDKAEALRAAAQEAKTIKAQAEESNAKAVELTNAAVAKAAAARDELGTAQAQVAKLQ